MAVLVSTTVNGDHAEFACEPNETLLDVLRNRLGLGRGCEREVDGFGAGRSAGHRGDDERRAEALAEPVDGETRPARKQFFHFCQPVLQPASSHSHRQHVGETSYRQNGNPWLLEDIDGRVRNSSCGDRRREQKEPTQDQ